VLFILPTTRRWIDRGFLALKAINLEDPVGWSLQVWLVGSTLVATVLLGTMFWRKQRAVAVGLPSEPLRLEGILVAAWWLIVIGASAYAFMLGMGG